MPTSPNRVAANQANACKSTGPRTPEGKARSSQNARKPPFNPDPFTIVRIEDRAQIAALVAGAIATYQPIDSQERDTVERIALAQHSMRRMSAIEAGFFTKCLDQSPMDPHHLDRAEIGKGVDVALDQHNAYSLAFGFNRYSRQSNIAAVFLRFQAQAERLYRHAVEDFHRLLKLRGQLPPEKYEEPIEPTIEPKPAPQPEENTAAPPSEPPISQPADEPTAQPSSANPRPEPVAKKRSHRARRSVKVLRFHRVTKVTSAPSALSTCYIFAFQ
jgi:hypothetical protein